METKLPTTRQLEEWKVLAEKATPGPWTDEPSSGVMVLSEHMTICDIRGWGYLTGEGGLNLTVKQAEAVQETNSAFIAASRTAIPTLIAAVERLRDALRGTKEHFAEIADAWERGALSSHDGKTGVRSNRNHDLLVKIAALLREMES